MHADLSSKEPRIVIYANTHCFALNPFPRGKKPSLLPVYIALFQQSQPTSKPSLACKIYALCSLSLSLSLSPLTHKNSAARAISKSSLFSRPRGMRRGGERDTASRRARNPGHLLRSSLVYRWSARATAAARRQSKRPNRRRPTNRCHVLCGNSHTASDSHKHTHIYARARVHTVTLSLSLSVMRIECPLVRSGSVHRKNRHSASGARIANQERSAARPRETKTWMHNATEERRERERKRERYSRAAHFQVL